MAATSVLPEERGRMAECLEGLEGRARNGATAQTPLQLRLWPLRPSLRILSRKGRGVRR